MVLYKNFFTIVNSGSCDAYTKKLVPLSQRSHDLTRFDSARRLEKNRAVRTPKATPILCKYGLKTHR
jgi:hypothetical protein